MKHWFLCGRDVMWVLIFASPIFGSFGCGMALGDSSADVDIIGRVMVMVVIVYVALIYSLYAGLIL